MSRRLPLPPAPYQPFVCSRNRLGLKTSAQASSIRDVSAAGAGGSRHPIPTLAGDRSYDDIANTKVKV
jgi:hypothetical protein